MISLILIIIAAILDGVMDMNMNMFQSSIFRNSSKYNPFFWDPSIAWKNKWKDGIGNSSPAFFGSTTFLVFLTDAWHLAKATCVTCIILAMIFAVKCGLIVPIATLPWYGLILVFFSIYILYGIVFEITIKALKK